MTETPQSSDTTPAVPTSELDETLLTQVPDLLRQQGYEGFGPEQHEALERLWEALVEAGGLGERKAEVYAAALEYTVIKVNGMDESQRQVATRYGVASSSVSSGHRALVELLGVEVPGDERYLVQALPGAEEVHLSELLPITLGERWTVVALALKSKSPFARVCFAIHDGKKWRHSMILGGATTTVSAAELLVVHLHLAMLEPAKGEPRRPERLRFVDGVEVFEEVRELLEALEVKLEVVTTGVVLDAKVKKLESGIDALLEEMQVREAAAGKKSGGKKKKKKKSKGRAES